MTDTKRDFLYEFNRGLALAYNSNPSIVSVFENIENGSLKLSPIEIPDADFVNEVSRCIFVIKKIAAEPFKVLARKQELLPVSQAKSIDQESVKLTLADPSLWAEKDGKKLPKSAYSLVSEDVFINYENAFICQLINLIIARLKNIRSKFYATLGVEQNLENSNIDKEYIEFSNKIDSHIRKLSRLSNEKVFYDNRHRVIDLSNIFVTDTLAKDNRYNYCYKFFCSVLKSSKKKSNVVKDFRVLYHNYALVQLLYNFYKNGYTFDEAKYYVPDSGKMFVDKICLHKDKKLEIIRTDNGIDIVSQDKVTHLEFSKVAARSTAEISQNYSGVVEKMKNKYSNLYVAYLVSDEQGIDGVLNIGYKNADKSVCKLIETL